MSNNDKIKINLQEFTFAENELPSDELFLGRKIFKENILFENSIDLWNDRINYGKVDEKNNSVFLSEQNLKPLKSNKTILVVDFVADAFEDFRNYLDLAKLKNFIKKDSPISDIEPEKGWESVSFLHHKMMEQIYYLYVVQFLNSENRLSSVINFNDFMNNFLLFLRENINNIFITRSGFILSKYCTTLISGLIVETVTGNHSSDAIKKIVYIDDENFNFYRTTAQKFGFLIDKNAPWRLIANVTSKEMQQYMRKRGLNEFSGEVNFLYDTYYYKSYQVDIDILKRYCLQMYNSFASSRPFVKEIKNKCNRLFLSEIKKREIFNSKENFEQKYDNKYWLSKYLEIRLLENNKNLEINEFNRLQKKIIEIYNVLDFDSSMRYINETIKEMN